MSNLEKFEQLLDDKLKSLSEQEIMASFKNTFEYKMKKLNIPEYDIFVDSDNKFWITNESYQKLYENSSNMIGDLDITYIYDDKLCIDFSVDTNSSIKDGFYSLSNLHFFKPNDILSEFGLPNVGTIITVDNPDPLELMIFDDETGYDPSLYGKSYKTHTIITNLGGSLNECIVEYLVENNQVVSVFI